MDIRLFRVDSVLQLNLLTSKFSVMNNSRFLFLLLLFTVFGHSSAGKALSQNIVINEIMASNATTHADEDGDYEDWIELYNAGGETVYLDGWALSDHYHEPYQWMFPPISMEPGEYLLVWASGKDRTENELHTNFRISSAGEELILVDPQGNWADHIPPLWLPTDISLGRYPDGSDDLWYYTSPTPGQPNSSGGYPDLLEAPHFSHASGFFTHPFYLKVTHPDPQVELRYTLDGSLPTSQSPLMPDSLWIYNRKHDADQISAIPTTSQTAPEWYRWFPPMDTVFKGTNIRVKAFKEGSLNPFAQTRTYWVDEDIFSRYSLPVISISMDQDDLLGSSGIYTHFNQSGPNWERPVHISFFEADGSQGFATDAGIRVHGGNSRRYALKSFRVYFRNLYGHSHIDYPIFPDQQMNVHDRLILRNAGSDWAYTYFRDAFVQNILQEMTDVEVQAYRPAVVFLNSEYWGVMNIRERYDNNYIKNHYGITDIDMLDNTGQVKYGSNAHYMNLLSYLQNHSLEEEENYQWVKSRMDVDDFRDYHILQVFSMNTDQPGKNVRFWRPRTPEGRWRWMWWDMDDSFIFGPHNPYDRNGLIFCTGLDSISDPIVNPATPPPAWAPNGPVQTFPLRALLGSPTFRISFINRFADLLNTAFQPAYLHSLVDAFDQGVSDYMYEHYRRWHRPEPFQYNNHVNHLYNFSTHRIHYMREHLEAFFLLDGQCQVQLDVGSGNGHIRINSIAITTQTPGVQNPVYPWSGTYFTGLPLQVEAVAAPGYVFSHWEGPVDSENPVADFSPNADVAITAHFIPREEYNLISFWYFHADMPNNTPFESLYAYYTHHEDTRLEFHSCLEGYPFEPGHPLWRKASMERRNQPTPVNYLPQANDEQPYDPEHMRGLQIKQPLAGDAGENTLIFHLPTAGYEDIIFSFAAVNEGAAQEIILAYTTDEQKQNWTTHSILPLEESYQFYSANFSAVENAADNPHFAIRITFDTNAPEQDEGNRVTFNNISLEGTPTGNHLEVRTPFADQFVVYPNPVNGDKVFLKRFMDIQLFDLNGRERMSWHNINSFSVAALPPGLYLLRNQQGEWARLVVQR